MAGELYVVATPIGNLGDMVPRAVDVLHAVDVVAAEDTRHSGRLLSHLAIKTPLISYHDHSDDRQITKIIELLEQGKSVALISDAGTPLISDPGYKLVRAVRQQGFRVVPIPGPCALIAAISASGLPSDRFTFEGFPPAKTSARIKKFQSLVDESRTLVFYESPHRIVDTLADMSEVFGEDRDVVMARELTKTYETFLFGTLAEVQRQVESDLNQQKGEIVLIVKGVDVAMKELDTVEQQRVLSLLLDELPLKQAASLAAKITGGQKNALYQLALSLKK
ncbi:MAG: 16S rRNA (cytidine(1402)-2'-O)-methyltransferase [Porticoccus sp.]|nr:16S rRNA (cytidine(1402)-2'-O)-methyltransferase [Porticoccus sp.]|tara:strand:+ start:668 stop:1504 length:837 start_codon:yes stop_codon:yes gene_type:complete